MTSLDAFSTQKIFTGSEKFPYGIARSSEFNRKDAALLEAHGEAYLALHHGQRQPINAEEVAFVAMCNGEKEANTAHEIAWQRYLKKINTPIVVTSFKGEPGRDRANVRESE